MHRVDTSTAAPALPGADAAGTPGYFTKGDTGIPTPATVPGQDWFNAVQEELVALIEAGGLSPDTSKADFAQIRDAALILSRGGALGFRAKPQNPETLSLDIEAGAFFSRDTGLMVSVAAGAVGPIAAPGANPRNDIVYIDALTGAVGIETGTEDAAPVDPAIPADKVPIRRINAYVGMTEIVAADLDELRYLDSIGLSLTSGVLQIEQVQTGAVATGTTIMPLDDTIPQITEGDEYMTLAFTPKSAASRLRIDVVTNLSMDTNSLNLTAALFRDAGADAIAAGAKGRSSGNDQMENIKFSHDMASPGAALTTFRVRAGAHAAATTTLNGIAGARKYGGVLASSIIITEYMP